MNRRGFFALLGAVIAGRKAVALPKVGETFTIAGVYAINPPTRLRGDWEKLHAEFRCIHPPGCDRCGWCGMGYGS